MVVMPNLPDRRGLPIKILTRKDTDTFPIQNALPWSYLSRGMAIILCILS